MKLYEVYTDGSYRNSDGYGGMVHGGIVFWDTENGCIEGTVHVQSADSYLKAGWSNGGECLAVYMGLLMTLADLEESKIYEDEECLIRIICDYEGCTKWMTGEWSNHNKPSSSWYYDSMTTLLGMAEEISSNIKVEFKWVKGHADSYCNNVADEVAAYDMSGVDLHGARVLTWDNGKVVE